MVATYHDAALSSFGVEQRPGYQQLVAAASATPAGFETIVVEDLSRLTRDTGELPASTTGSVSGASTSWG